MPITISGGVNMGTLTGGPSATNLSDLHDVSIVSPVTNQYLRYNTATSEWQNTYLSYSVTGDALGTSTSGNIALTLATVNASPQTDAFRKITVNGKGLVTATSAVLAADITALVDTTYVKITGDTMTGSLTISGPNALRGSYGSGEVTSNFAAGDGALESNTDGFGNTASGRNALYSNTSGFNNIANGANALYSNTTGYSNIASGVNALQYNTTGYSNTANGDRVLQYNTTGTNNTASGVNALQYNTTGYSNTANGANALQYNTIGYYNTASGHDALYGNTEGYYNTASGDSALQYNTEGYYNAAFGADALYFSTTGYNNTAAGTQALNNNTTGYNNTAAGTRALNNNTTGYNNTAVGYNTGTGIGTGTGNTILGANVIGLTAGLTNNIILASGNGVIKGRHDGTNWSFTGSVTATSFTGPTSGNASTATKLQTARTISATGDATWATLFDGSANVTSALTLATVNANAGQFAVSTANAKGLVTSATNISGDITTLGAVATLATVNAAPQVNTFTKLTVNGKGLVTATSAVTPGDITTSLGYTPVNKSGDTMTGALILNANPSIALGAATKQYVDNIASGLNAHASSATATGAALPASVYNNGTSGVGATLTASVNGAIGSINGYAVVLNDRVLVKDQATAFQNGIYVATQLGAVGTPWILTRAADFDNSPTFEVEAGDFTYVRNGTLAGTQWVLVVTTAVTIGTTGLPFSQLSGAGSLVGGTGISVAGNVITNTGVLSNIAGTGISVSGATGNVTVTNTGVTSITGTSNQIVTTASTGAVTLSLPSSVTIVGTLTAGTVSGSHTGSGAGLTNIPNAALTNSSLTIGSTNIALGATATTLAGLTSVSATTFTGALSGNATSASSVTFAGVTSKPDRSQWPSTSSLDFVSGQLAWKNYGAGHAIFDASAGTNPIGGAINATNSDNPWSSSYPTLMGFNGVSTYGVRVDSSRVAGSAGTAGTVTTAAQPAITSVGILTGLTVNGTISATGAGNDYNVGGVMLNGNGAANTVFPTLGFHQPGLYASSIQLRGGADFRFYGQGATGYANITAATITGSGAGLTNVPNSAFVNSSLTVGSTNIALGATATTLAGLTSVTSTTFVGALSGNATTATTAGTVTNAAQLTITSVGTLSSLTATGAIIFPAQNAGIELGSTTTANTPFVDFHSSGNNIDFDSRIIASGGTASTGAGTLTLIAAAGVVVSNNLTASGTITATTFNATSTKRVKKAIKNLSKGYLAKFSKLRPCEYDRKDYTAHEFGFIAEEMLLVYPEVVGIDAEGKASGIDYGKLSTILTAKVQEQQSVIEQLQSQMATVMALVKGLK
jgi:hypothetical protein